MSRRQGIQVQLLGTGLYKEQTILRIPGTTGQSRFNAKGLSGIRTLISQVEIIEHLLQPDGIIRNRRTLTNETTYVAVRSPIDVERQSGTGIFGRQHKSVLQKIRIRFVSRQPLPRLLSIPTERQRRKCLNRFGFARTLQRYLYVLLRIPTGRQRYITIEVKQERIHRRSGCDAEGALLTGTEQQAGGQLNDADIGQQ